MTVCRAGTSYCGDFSISYQISGGSTFWSDSQINVYLLPTAAFIGGSYTVQVTSAGEARTGFVAGPGQSSQSNVVAIPGTISGAPITMSMYPAYGTYVLAAYAFTFTDPVAATNLTSASVTFQSSSGTCTWTYAPGTNGLSYSEPGLTLGPYVLGTATGTVGSICKTTLDVSSASMSGTNLVLLLTIGVNPGYGSTVYMEAQSTAGGRSSFQAKGTTGPAQPGVVECYLPPDSDPNHRCIGQ